MPSNALMKDRPSLANAEALQSRQLARTQKNSREEDGGYDIGIPITVEFPAPSVLNSALRNGAECSSLEPLGLLVPSHRTPSTGRMAARKLFRAVEDQDWVCCGLTTGFETCSKEIWHEDVPVCNLNVKNG